MKQSFIYTTFIIFLFSSTSFAQLGPISQSYEDQLLATDPSSTEHLHYKPLTFSLKAGAGILFFMESDDFTPSIYLTDSAGVQIGKYRIPDEDEGHAATAAVNAFTVKYPNIPINTFINIYFTTVEKNATGKFKYGYIMLDSSQMLYDQYGPLCKRLIYLINHWQASWSIIPASNDGWKDPRDYATETENCLMPYETKRPAGTGEGIFEEKGLTETPGYYEILQKSSKDSCLKFYDKLVKEIKQCLGDKDWTVTTEVQHNEILQRKYFYTHFIIKSSSETTPRRKFSIERIVPDNKGENYVSLMFE